MNITKLTLDQLRGMSRADIRNAINDYFQAMTKREMILWLMETDTIQDNAIDTYENGQLVKRIEYVRDVETGEKVRGKVTTWTYYPTGEINVIRIAETNATDGEVSHIRIKHYLDNRRPRITEID
jgi:hypothetical protein